MELEALFESVTPEEQGEFGEKLDVGHSSNAIKMSHNYFATNTSLIMYSHVG